MCEFKKIGLKINLLLFIMEF